MSEQRTYRFNLSLLLVYKEFRRGSVEFAHQRIEELRGLSSWEGAVLDAISGWLFWESGAKEAATESWNKSFLTDEAPADAMFIAGLGRGMKYVEEKNDYMLNFVLQGTDHLREPEDNIWIAYAYLRFMEALAQFERFADAEVMYTAARGSLHSLGQHQEEDMEKEAMLLGVQLDLSYASEALAEAGRHDEAEALILERVIPAYAKLREEEKLADGYRRLSGVYFDGRRYFEALLIEEQYWEQCYGKVDKTKEWIDSCVRLKKIVLRMKMKFGPEAYLLRLLRRHGSTAPEEELIKIREHLKQNGENGTEE